MNLTEKRVVIRAVNSTDASAIASIYNWYVVHSNCTFEEEPVSDGEMLKRVLAADSSMPWIVLQDGEELPGYAYASLWKARAAYNRSREVTVYLHKDAQGSGRGKRLYQHLIGDLSIT